MKSRKYLWDVVMLGKPGKVLVELGNLVLVRLCGTLLDLFSLHPLPGLFVCKLGGCFCGLFDDLCRFLGGWFACFAA